MKIIIASKNEGKIKEILKILGLESSDVLTYRDFEDWPDVEETGETFEENALIKARALTEKYSFAAVADDSGLEVDFLSGEPGVISARYAGVQGDDKANVAKLLKNLEGIKEEERAAKFTCVAALTLPNGNAKTALGICKGHIATEPRGTKGFGYDPIFIPCGYDQTMAELDIETKNEISHRGKAFRQMKAIMISLENQK